MTKNASSRSRRWLVRGMILVVCVIAIWLLGDFVYSRVVSYRLGNWEATIERDPDGIQQGCREYLVGDGTTALLLVHGINDSPHGYRKMAPRLVEHGFTCRVMRLPGFAEPMNRFAYVTRRDWIEAVEHEVEQLRKSHQRVCIIAHSLGGAVTIAYLLDQPDAVDCVVLLAPAIQVSDQRSPWLSTRMWHEIGRWTLLFTQTTQSPFENDTHDPSERPYLGGAVFMPRQIFDESFQLMDANRERAVQLTTPLMVVLSKDDQVIDWQAAERFFEQTSSPIKQLHFVPDAGHVIPVDYGWEEVTDQIADFVKAN